MTKGFILKVFRASKYFQIIQPIIMLSSPSVSKRYMTENSMVY